MRNKSINEQFYEKMDGMFLEDFVERLYTNFIQNLDDDEALIYGARLLYTFYERHKYDIQELYALDNRMARGA